MYGRAHLPMSPDAEAHSNLGKALRAGESSEKSRKLEMVPP